MEETDYARSELHQSRFQQRVLVEKFELDERLGRLQRFILGPCSVPPDEQRRLSRQRLIMELYSGVLAERLEGFKFYDLLDSQLPGFPGCRRL